MLVEREKKKFDMQTYREIIAFTEGKSLSEIEKAREEGKRPYQKVLLAVASRCSRSDCYNVFLVAAGIASIYRWEKQETEPKGRNLLQHMCESE